MNKFNDQVNFWAHMLDKSSRDDYINESIQDKCVIIISYGTAKKRYSGRTNDNMFQPFYGNRLNGLGRSLSFEVYYIVEKSIVNQLLQTSVIHSNCKYKSPSIIEILTQNNILENPFATIRSGIKDYYSRLSSPEKTRSRCAQTILNDICNKIGDIPLIYRFSFCDDINCMHREDVFLDNKRNIIDTSKYIQKYGKNGKPIALQLKDSDQLITDFTTITLLAYQGFWKEIVNDGDQFIIENSNILAPSEIGKKELQANHLKDYEMIQPDFIKFIGEITTKDNIQNPKRDAKASIHDSEQIYETWSNDKWNQFADKFGNKRAITAKDLKNILEKIPNNLLDVPLCFNCYDILNFNNGDGNFFISDIKFQQDNSIDDIGEIPFLNLHAWEI